MTSSAYTAMRLIAAVLGVLTASSVAWAQPLGPPLPKGPNAIVDGRDIADVRLEVASMAGSWMNPARR